MPEELILSEHEYLVYTIFTISDVGLTRREYLTHASQAGVSNPEECLDRVIGLGLVKLQDRSKERREDCIKATNKAFNVIVRVEREVI